VINGPPFGREAAKTERAAIEGWGPTLRLLTLRAGGAACWASFQVIAVMILHRVN
jgi:hypothetical protein